MSKLNSEKHELEFLDYAEEFRAELNTWQKLEAEQGLNGLDRFVVAGGVLLGDFLKYISTDMNISTKIVLDKGELVGFISYEIKEDNSAHVELTGTSPKFRKRGYSKKILSGLKELLVETKGIERLTLAVNKENQAGINSFSKIAKENKNLDHDNYIGFEL